MFLPRPTLGPTVTIALAACGILTSEVEKSATVSIDDTVLSVSQNGSVEGTLAVVIANDSRSVIYYGPCAEVLEQEMDEDWEVVWSMVCSLVLPDPLQIAPGESASIEVEIRATLGHSVSSGWRQPVEGRYRLTLGLGSDAGPLSREFLTSNSFRISAR